MRLAASGAPPLHQRSRTLKAYQAPVSETARLHWRRRLRDVGVSGGKRGDGPAGRADLTGKLLALSGFINPYPGCLDVVAEGALADLVLVDGNLLEDIK